MITALKNWEVGTTPKVLGSIHQPDVNITLYNRDIEVFKGEINNLLQRDIECKANGNSDTIINEVIKISELDADSMIIQDIQNLLGLFKEITQAKCYRLLLTTIKTDMCRKFHVDINDLRMLCTYSGPGTLWLTEDNVDRKALDSYGNNVAIVIDENNIKQAQTGAVIILKGAKYSKKVIKAAVHRSPTIEEYGKKRLLLRIDTN